ncbi:hypothetical protein FQA47_002134 [Oryzias melastigma]|uniref:Uncharacterized protein n=1 Tax=Oryzias melastigma TaxID=30732 RepID=A0A834F1E1_ORYME|nr:hypothetical protein FQA47_002134 [Oryzias melastigma]
MHGVPRHACTTGAHQPDAPPSRPSAAGRSNAEAVAHSHAAFTTAQRRFRGWRCSGSSRKFSASESRQEQRRAVRGWEKRRRSPAQLDVCADASVTEETEHRSRTRLSAHPAP